MPKYNKYVQIDTRGAMVAVGIEKAMTAFAQRNPRLIAVLEDMGFPGLGWFIKNLPQQMVEVGIAEQNGAVIAAGLAAEGYIPVINSFMFAALGRAYNQVRQSVLVDRFNVKIIGREGVWGETGISHNTIEGVASARVLPNLILLNPADVVEAEKATTAMLQYVGPVLLRQESSPTPYRIFSDDYPFDIGQAYCLKNGRDATIITTGYMLSQAIKAMDIFEKERMDVGLVNMGTLKPLDEAAIVAAAQESGAIVTAENASIIGGLGEGVAGVLARHYPVPMSFVGVEDEFSQSGLIREGKDELAIHFGFGPEDLVMAVKDVIAKKKVVAKARNK
jgi:transketolase